MLNTKNRINNDSALLNLKTSFSSYFVFFALKEVHNHQRGYKPIMIFALLMFIGLFVNAQNVDSLKSIVSGNDKTIRRLNKEIKIKRDSLNELKSLNKQLINKIKLSQIETSSKHYIVSKIETSIYESLTEGSTKLIEVAVGDKLQFYEKSKEWWLVSKDNKVGYVHNRYIDRKSIPSEVWSAVYAANRKAREEAERIIKEREDSLLQLAEVKLNRLRNKGIPIIIKDVTVDDINSAGGVEFFIKWQYINDKKVIKYIEFTVVPYNEVGDLQKCSIRNKTSVTCQVTGPIENFSIPANYYWYNTWYNSTISCVKLSKVKVIYMDGTQYTYIRELPKLFDEEFKNSCKYGE